MDLLKVSKQINLKIQELETMKESLNTLGAEKSTREAEYDKSMAKSIIGLRNGLITQMDGIEVKDLSASLAISLAKGLCYNEKLAMDLSETKYRNCLKIIDITQSQLMGYQSINKFLAEV